MRRIGIYGGTFNPIHLGHLICAQMVLQKMKLDEVIFVPCFQPPHKTEKHLIDSRHRLRMVKLATANNPKFKVSDYEIEAGGKSFTINTLKYYKQKYPTAEIFFIIGGDSLNHLSYWKEIDQITEIATFIAVNRPGYRLARPKKIRCKTVEMPAIGISSSLLRHYLACGFSIRYLTTKRVADYIAKNKLYLK